LSAGYGSDDVKTLHKADAVHPHVMFLRRFERSEVSGLQLDDLGRVQPAGILTWAEVNRTHRIRNGVYQRQGRLISLLTDFGKINPCYPDRLDETGQIITYTGAGRHGDQQLDPPNRALLAAIEQGHTVPLFNKLGVGRWQHTGFWRVIEGKYLYDEGEERMLWRFILKRHK